jgi:asparagine synthase (glutamine-hydrolysing)
MKLARGSSWHPPTFASAYRSFRGIFSHQEALTIVQQLLGESLIYQQQLDSNQNTPEDEVSFLELSRYMRNQLLRDSDVMSMNWGL